MRTTPDCIGIREYLLRRGLQPHHETATHGMFLSPLREERTPSFSVRYDKGLWYDFGLGEGGTLLQLVMRLEGCSMAEAIRSLRKGSADEVPFQPLPTALPREDSPLRVLGVEEIRHPAQIGYLRADTHADNRPMQRLLEAYGFRRCGVIHGAVDGGERIAYDCIAHI